MQSGESLDSASRKMPGGGSVMWNAKRRAKRVLDVDFQGGGNGGTLFVSGEREPAQDQMNQLAREVMPLGPIVDVAPANRLTWRETRLAGDNGELRRACRRHTETSFLKERAGSMGCFAEDEGLGIACRSLNTERDSDGMAFSVRSTGKTVQQLVDRVRLEAVLPSPSGSCQALSAEFFLDLIAGQEFGGRTGHSNGSFCLY